MTRGERGAAAGGLVFVLLLFTGSFVVSTPSAFNPVGVVIAQYVQHRTAILVSCYLSILAGPFFLLFLASLRRILERAAQEESPLPAVSFAAGALATGVVYVWYAIPAALALGAATPRNGAVVQALLGLSTVLGFFSDVLFGVTVAAASIEILRTRVLPRWLGVVGLVSAALFGLNQLSIAQPRGPLGLAGLLGFLLFLVWMLTTSITLLRASGVRLVPARAAGRDAYPAVG